MPTTTKLSRITYRQALLVGAWQVLALIPGTSRSGSTIIGGLLCGMSRACASQFTFFLAIPVMAGASGLKLVKFLAGGGVFTVGEIGALLVGCIVAFVVSILAIRFLMDYVKKHTFTAFGWGTVSPWASSSWVSGPCRHSCWRNIVNKNLLSPGMGGQQLFGLVGAKPPLSKGGAAKGGGGIPSGFTGAACPGERAEPPPACFAATSPPCGGGLLRTASPSAKGSPYRGAGRAREA